ncbi:MAG: SurA N-terminal domain-containing protein, partial [Paludibacteraceae bacterium]|nr:SurA N-terminal domain-containing protein [Paludibacteraceae bacterium]
MAAIGKIRQHYGILVIIIGLALLAFVLGDLFKSTSKRRQTDVAVVNGEKITYQDFTNRAEQNIQYQKRMYGNLTNDQAFNVRQQTLDQMIREIIMEDQYKALGLGVSKAELTDNFIGEKPNQYVLNSFKDKDGNFDRDALITYINDVENGTYGPDTRAQWDNFVNAIEEDVMNTKYESLLKHAFYLPKKLADRYNDNKNLKRNAEVYAVRYTSIPDSTVVVTDQDNKKYYDTYKTKYPTDAMRGIDYVVFEVKPSEADRASAKTFVENRKADFAQVENVAGYVANNSDSMIDEEWHKTTDYNADLEKAIVDNEVGFVYGPYEENDAFNIARIMGKEMRNDTLWAQVAVVSRDITVSTVTDQAIFAEVNKFVTENKTQEQFNAAIEAQGLNKRTFQSIRENTNRIAGISNPREIVRWAFNSDTKIGDMSKVFERENMYVVAVLTKIVPEGYIPYEDLIERNAVQIRKAKKGEMIAEKAKAYGNNYDMMIKDLNGEKTTVENITMEGRGFGSFGVEEKIGGTTMGMPIGVYSAPIEGGNAFAIVMATTSTEAGATDFDAIRKEYVSKFNNAILNGSHYSAMLDNAKVKNNGVMFF